jgi:enoyl-CoA hydratase
MENYRHIKVIGRPGGVLDVRLSRPPANAVDRDMYIELAALFRDPDRHVQGLQAIVLSGEGRFFCAGNDLAEFGTMTPDNGTERMWRVREAFSAIQECAVPVIAAVHGVALGTGIGLAASCDFIVAAPDALFGLPEITIAVMGGARHLARFAPQPVVRRMFFTGERVRADALAQMTGAIVLSEDQDSLLDTAFGFADRIASFSPTAVRVSKRLLNAVEDMPLQEGYAFEQRYTVRLSGHPDSKEALHAFADRRAPVFLPLDKNEMPIA